MTTEKTRKEKTEKALQWFTNVYMFVVTAVIAYPAYADVSTVLQKINDFCMMIVDNPFWTSILLLVFVFQVVKFSINHNVEHIVKAVFAGVGGGAYYARHEIWQQITS